MAGVVGHAHILANRSIVHKKPAVIYGCSARRLFALENKIREAVRVGNGFEVNFEETIIDTPFDGRQNQHYLLFPPSSPLKSRTKGQLCRGVRSWGVLFTGDIQMVAPTFWAKPIDMCPPGLTFWKKEVSPCCE